MKLYEVPRNSIIKILPNEEHTLQGPPDARGFKPGEIIKFRHVDGMYSSCKDKTGADVYLKAWTEVEVMPEGTELS